MAELAKIGQILANLRVSEAKAFAQLLAGDGSTRLALEIFELSQVQAEPPNCWIGNGFRSRRLHETPGESRIISSATERSSVGAAPSHSTVTSVVCHCRQEKERDFAELIW
jgi:hypothetical protein